VSRLLTVALAIPVLAFAACGGDDEESADTTATEPVATTGDPEPSPGGEPGQAPKPRQKPGIEITTGGSDYGTILFDADDQAIYLFDKESSDRSECYGACAEAWPPVLTDGEPQAAGGVEQGQLGTTERDDGGTQVTYAGHPLYYYVDDPPGQVLCHNVEEFGGLWLVVDPGGEAVR
jgi:predicted lipoprotein with Yx(FWY)xxD motif